MLRIIFIVILCIVSILGSAQYANIDDFDLINFYIENEIEIVETKPDSDLNEKKDIIESEEVKVVQEKEKKKSIIYNEVPFTTQAPLAEWDDPRQQDGCEEAVSLMAVYWAREKNLNKIIAKEEILKISKYQEDYYNNYIDTSVEDTAKIILDEYFGFSNFKILDIEVIEDIISELERGNVIIVPTNGQLLNNPNFTPPGPERHNVLVIGYSYEDREFITNDPGTRRGKDFRYNKEVLFNAIIDYPSGDHEPIIDNTKRMIVVKK